MKMKVGWFQGDAQQPKWEIGPPPPASQDLIMARAESKDPRTPTLSVLLVPQDTSLTELGGDDWNDAPADCNASRPYRRPDGSVWLELALGDEWPASDGDALQAERDVLGNRLAEVEAAIVEHINSLDRARDDYARLESREMVARLDFAIGASLKLRALIHESEV